MEEAKSSIRWTDDCKGIPVHVADQTAYYAYRPSKFVRRLYAILGLFILLWTFHFTLYTRNAGSDQFTRGEEDLWMVDAFMHQGHSQNGKSGPLRGKDAEKLYLSVPNATSAIAASRQYATKPHMAGTPGDLDTANDFLTLLQRELGIKSSCSSESIYPAGSAESRHATLSIPTTNETKAWIDVYYPILNTPLHRSLEILGNDGKPVWQANLEEVVDETDPEAYKYADAIPSFHGLSANGDVEGRLVYANYGRKIDYDALVEAGVDFYGKIVITRYGRLFRGLKVKGAQELGAAGVLVYSDLRDDGTVTQENGYVPYPHGPARNPTSVQRGSVQFISKFPGDPTTPGYPSYENSTRTKGTNIPDIPSLPISAATAEVLLKEIEEGGLNRVVKLVNQGDYKVTPIWNTYGLIPGHIKDEVIVVGNHRDAWVMGATDPSSGTVSIHELVRGLGVLLRHGWKPLRSILIASWDAEEYGLIGSTEWGEDFAEFIDKNVAVYLNLDSANSGSRFHASASPSLAHFVRDTAEEIPHPTDKGRTLWDARFDTGTLFGDYIDKEVLAVRDEELGTDDSFGVGALGSGSDYTVFLQHIGVASAQAAFQSTLHDPVYHYHSVFDSERWQELFSDPGFPKHITVAKHLGLQTLRLSDALILPLNTTHYSYELENYLDKVESIASSLALDVDLSTLRKSIQSLQAKSLKLDVEKNKAERELVRLIKKWKRRHAKHIWFRRRARMITCRVAKFFGSRICSGRDQELSMITVGCSVIKPRVGRLADHLQEQREQCENPLAYGHPSRRFIKAVKRVRAVNQKLIVFERGFISEGGIRDREWYRHLGVAPGKWLGYGATTLPAVTESLTLDRNSTLAQYEADRFKCLIDQLVHQIRV